MMSQLRRVFKVQLDQLQPTQDRPGHEEIC